jgi:hypothetical protein
VNDWLARAFSPWPLAASRTGPLAQAGINRAFGPAADHVRISPHYRRGVIGYRALIGRYRGRVSRYSVLIKRYMRVINMNQVPQNVNQVPRKALHGGDQHESEAAKSESDAWKSVT